MKVEIGLNLLRVLYMQCSSALLMCEEPALMSVVTVHADVSVVESRIAPGRRLVPMRMAS